MRTTTWVIKLSKFCNMRCAYCYEWNELSERRRMSFDLWERVLQAVIHVDGEGAARFPGVPQRSLIIFHGGEPLALPSAYLEQLLRRFRELTEGSRGRFDLALQTNLLSVSDDKLALLRHWNVGLSISFDLAPGVRLTASGEPSEGRVAANIDRLRGKGIQLGGIAVLAKHTLPRLAQIYDFYADRGMPMRILPLFDGPTGRDLDSFSIDHASLVGGLQHLFQHWIETDCRIPLYPLNEYFEAALRYLSGVRRSVWSRAWQGDGVLLVNVDGKVYRVLDAYEESLALGDLQRQTMGEILRSDAYALSLVRDREEFDQHCGSCEYLGACSGAPIYGSRTTATFPGRCPTAHACIAFIVAYLQGRGYGSEEIRMLRDAAEGTRQGASVGL